MRILTITGVVTLLTAAASAQVVAGATFSFTGPLTSNGWSAHSGAGNKVIQSNGSYAILDQSAGSGEDVNIPFAPFSATDTIWASFTLNVPSGNPVNPLNGLYFIHFKDTTTLFRARTGIVGPGAGGDYRIAINADNANLVNGVQWPTDLLFDTDYRIVFNWDAATDTSTLWVDPLLPTDLSITHGGALTGTIISQIALRQASDYTGFIHVDDVQVGRSFADVQGQAPAFYNYGAGCPSSVGVASNVSTELPQIGATWTTVIGNMPAPEVALLLVGSGQTPPVDLSGIGALGCNSYITTDVLSLFGLGAGGATTFSVPVPANPQFVGLTLYSQAAVFEVGINPLSIVTSDAALNQIGS